MISVNYNCCIQISLKIIPNGQVDNKWELAYINVNNGLVPSKQQAITSCMKASSCLNEFLDDCHSTSPMRSEHWFRLGAIRQQATT